MAKKVNDLPAFETLYRVPRRFYCNAGSREKIEYAPKFDKQGQWHLVETGRSNLYAEIQSHVDSCDINTIVRRYAMGEVDVLQKVQGAYGDFLNVPKNLAEMLNTINDARTNFDSLPVEVKEKFGQNFVQFMDEFGTAEWYSKLGFQVSEPAKEQIDAKDEVKSDES